MGVNNITENEKKYIPRHYYDAYEMYKNREKPPLEEENHPILDLYFSPRLVLYIMIWFLIVAIGSIFVGAME